MVTLRVLITGLVLGCNAAVVAAPLPTCFAAYPNRAELLVGLSALWYEGQPPSKGVKSIEQDTTGESVKDVFFTKFSEAGLITDFGLVSSNEAGDVEFAFEHTVHRQGQQVYLQHHEGGQANRKTHAKALLTINEHLAFATVAASPTNTWRWEWDDENCSIIHTMTEEEMPPSIIHFVFNEQGKVLRYVESFSADKPLHHTFLFDAAGKHNRVLINDTLYQLTSKYNQRGDWTSLALIEPKERHKEMVKFTRIIEYYP